MKNANRRTLLKSMAVSAPVAWSAPVVNSVVLPAHAVTSGAGCVFWLSNNLGDLYVDFEGGNSLSADAPAWIDNPTCSGSPDTISGCANVYVPSGTPDPQSVANELCGQEAERFDESSDVWSCFCE